MSDRDRVATALAAHPGSTAQGLSMATGIRGGVVYSALTSLRQLGLADHDYAGRWKATATTPTPKEKPVRASRKQKRAGGSSTTPSRAAIEQSRRALAVRVYGETAAAHGDARRACEADPVLTQRLDAYEAAGAPPIDLTDVPRHRRPQVVEDALDTWAEQTEGAPNGCDWCGSAVRRHGRDRRWDTPRTPPGFTTVGANANATTACGWCADVLRDGGDHAWRAQVLGAVVGVRSTLDGYDLTKVVPAACELTPRPAATTTPFAYLSTERRALIREVARITIHRSRWATTVGAAAQASIPFIEAPVHTADTLPPKPPVTYLEHSRAAQARLEADKALAAKNAREKEERDARWHSHLASLRERDAREHALSR